MYSVPAPANGTWTATANGSYNVAIRQGEVTDKVGNPVPAGSLGTFTVSINAAAPTASLVTQDVLSATTPVTLKVTYATTDGGILVSSLDSNDLIITAPDGVTTTTAQFVSADIEHQRHPRPRPTTSTRRPAGGTSATTARAPSRRRPGSVHHEDRRAARAAVLGTFQIKVSPARTSSRRGRTYVSIDQGDRRSRRLFRHPRGGRLDDRLPATSPSQGEHGTAPASR